MGGEQTSMKQLLRELKIAGFLKSSVRHQQGVVHIEFKARKPSNPHAPIMAGNEGDIYEEHAHGEAGADNRARAALTSFSIKWGMEVVEQEHPPIFEFPTIPPDYNNIVFDLHPRQLRQASEPNQGALDLLKRGKLVNAISTAFR